VSGYVLVVDDDPAIREALATTILVVASQRARTASNGQEAIEAATAEHPALILLDLNMPEADGIEVFRRLRGAGVESPTVLMSAGAKDLGQRAEAAGFSGYISKPFTVADVMDLVDRFIPSGAV
jgi:CheY-like chemotaxis protein